MNSLNSEALEKYNNIKEKNKNTDSEMIKFNFFKFFMENPNEKTNIIDLFKDDIKDIYKIYLLSSIINTLSNRTNKKINILEENTNPKENYKEILKKSKELALELNLSNSLEIANLYTYLLWNGYFSKNKELKYQTHSRLLLPGMYSRDIMNGIGVCLNFSDMLTDFINQFDCYSSATLLNNINKNFERHYKVDIERKIVPNKFSRKIITPFIIPITKKTGNHAYNLICEKGNLYIYDSTNLSASKLNNKFESSVLAGKGVCNIKPYLSYWLNNSNKSTQTLDLLHLTQHFTSPYTSKDFVITWEECLELFRKNKYLLDDFYDEIYNNIINIYNDNVKAKELIKKSKVKNK